MNQRQEVFAVTAANLAAGIAGGLPATAALARTALNIRSGAASRLAGIFNAVFTLLISAFLLPFFGYLPLCVVASLLFQVAVGMIETKHLHHSFAIDREAFWLTLLVGACCIIFDPTAGIVIGAIFGLLRFAEHVATGYSEVTLTKDMKYGTQLDLHLFDERHRAAQKEGIIIAAWQKIFGKPESTDLQTARRELESLQSTTFDGQTIVYRIVGDLTYIAALHHMSRLKRMDTSKNLIISFRYCFYVDMDGLDALEETLLDLLRSGGNDRLILVSAIQPHSLLSSLLHKSTWFESEFQMKGHVFDHVAEASRFLVEHQRIETSNRDDEDAPTRQSEKRRMSLDQEIS